ncbi:MAG: ribosomal protein S18-alanine N-acetyltransferase [Mangrovibacterium sp.]
MSIEKIEIGKMSDLKDLMRIEIESFGDDAFSKTQMTYLLSKAKGSFFVARSERELMGYVSFLVSDRYRNGRIYAIAVNSKYRGQGVARALLTEVLSRGKNQQLNKVFLEVRTDNQAAINLYKQNGFEYRSEKKNYYHDGSSAYSMVLFL